MKTTYRYLIPLLVVMSLMFLWNLSRNINDVLIPHFKRAFLLTDFQSSLVQSAFFCAYFLLALPVGLFIQRFGYRAGMITGLFTAAIGAFLFFPAAETRFYPLFLTALFVMAAGFTFLEVTATPYISILGEPEKASSRLSLASAIGSLGSMLGPYIGAKFLLHTTDITESTLQQFTPSQLLNHLHSEADLVKMPYLSLTILLIMMSLVLYFIKLPNIKEEGKEHIQLKAIFQFKHTILGALGVFCYLGAEVGIVSFLIRYAKSLQLANLGEQRAALFITLFMTFVLVGRLSGAYLLQKINASKILVFCSASAMILVFTSMVTSGYLAIYTLSLIGLFTSVLYPILFTLSIKNLGIYTKTGSSIIIMSIVGCAIIPPLMGLVSDLYSIKWVFSLPFICYLYIIYYVQKGHIIPS